MAERAPHLEDDIAAETAATAEHLRLSVGVAEMSKTEALHGGLIDGEEKGEGSEDRALYDDAHRLYGAIDGMGGYHGGAIAAETILGAALSYIAEHDGTFTPENGADLMRDMFRAASNAVNERAATDPALGSMGAVAAIGHFFEHDGRSYIAAGVVGDAKFILRHEGEEKAIVSADECLPPPNGNIVTNVIQPGFDTELNQFNVYEVKDGDRAAFLTDGITGDDKEDKLRPGEGKHALSLATPQEAAEYFLSVSADRKLDDKTAVVVGVHMSVPDIEAVPEPTAATSPEAKALEALAAREGFSSPAELKDFLASLFDAMADPRNPHHAIAGLELNKRRSAAFRRAYQEYAAARVAEVTDLAKPEPAPAPDETAPEPRTPETPAETIARLEAENTRLHERVTELETRIDRLTTEITSLRTRIDELLATRPPEPEPAPSPVPEPRPRPPRPEAGGGDDTEFGPDRVPDHLVKYYELTRAEALANVGKGIAILAEYMPVADLRKQATRGAFVAAYERAEAMFRDHGEYSKYLATLGTHPEATDPRGDDDDEEESGDLAAALAARRLSRRRTS